jgi:hypothetical protein
VLNIWSDPTGVWRKRVPDLDWIEIMIVGCKTAQY